MNGKRSFIPLFVTNLFGTMNDNFLKTLASFVVIGWIQDASLRPVFMGVTAGALVLPFILCSPLADRLTVVFPKRRILQLAKWAEIPIVGIGIAGFAFHSAALVVAAILLWGFRVRSTRRLSTRSSVTSAAWSASRPAWAGWRGSHSLAYWPGPLRHR